MFKLFVLCALVAVALAGPTVEPAVCTIGDDSTCNDEGVCTDAVTGVAHCDCGLGFYNTNCQDESILGYDEEEEYVYRLVPNKDSWNTAAARCKSQYNGTLASIRSAAEQAFFFEVLMQSNDVISVWIGLKRQGNFGFNTWEDGTDVTYENYDLGEPNNYQGKEDCVAVGHESDDRGQAGEWNDAICNNRRYYACKWANPEAITTTTSTTNTRKTKASTLQTTTRGTRKRDTTAASSTTTTTTIASTKTRKTKATTTTTTTVASTKTRKTKTTTTTATTKSRRRSTTTTA